MVIREEAEEDASRTMKAAPLCVKKMRTLISVVAEVVVEETLARRTNSKVDKNEVVVAEEIVGIIRSRVRVEEVETEVATEVEIVEIVAREAVEVIAIPIRENRSIKTMLTHRRIPYRLLMMMDLRVTRTRTVPQLNNQSVVVEVVVSVAGVNAAEVEDVEVVNAAEVEEAARATHTIKGTLLPRNKHDHSFKD